MRGTVERTATRIPDRADVDHDWAMLALDRPLTEIAPLAMHSALPRGATPYRTYGFARVNTKDGIVFSGVVENPSATYGGHHALQLFSPQVAAPETRIEGLSGAPVFIDGAVVAIVRTCITRNGIPAAGTIYACPARAPLLHDDRPATQALTLPRPLEDTPRFRLLTTDDFSPSATAAPSLRVGYRPSLKLMRERQFMTRTAHLDDAVGVLERMLADRTCTDYHELDVFWISGRSGSGKSVLLLQLMERMVDQGKRVVWLDDDSSRLLLLLKTVHPDNEMPEDHLPDLVFVDDLYSPKGQAQLSLDDIRRQISAAPEHPWPIVVTCGPPEFEQRLQREAADDSIHLETWRLSPVLIKEASELQQWFRSRTGVAAQTGTAFQQTEGLMVSMAFEMQHGLLGPFARRFKERLAASRLAGPLYIPLAMNRLYVMTPTNWLDREEWERLALLNREGDFSIFEYSHGARYLRLTHPHISDAIYRAVREDGSPEAFANDLANALCRAWDTDPFTLRQLLRQLATGNERLDAVDMIHLVKTVGAAWQASDLLQLRQDPAALADALTALAAWAGHRPDLPLDKQFGAPLLPQALVALDAAGSSWPYLWMRLDAAYQGDIGVRKAALAWLEHPASAGRHWALVWRRVWNSQPPLALQEKARLVMRGLQWVRTYLNGDAWASVYESLLDVPNLTADSERSDILALGCDWVVSRMSRGLSWFRVWQRTLAANDLPEPKRVDMLERGVARLVDSNLHAWPDWWRLWEHVVGEAHLPSGIDRAQLLALGLKELRSTSPAPSTSYIWARLLTEQNLPDGLTREGLITWALQLVIDHPDRKDWYYFWRTLVELTDLSQAQRDTLLSATFQWLLGHDEHVGWSYVLEFLLTQGEFPAAIEPAKVIERGLLWLTTMEGAKAYTRIWSSLVRAHERWPDKIELDMLADHVRRWLKQESDHIWAPMMAAKAIAIATRLQEHDEVARWLGHWLDEHYLDPRKRHVEAVVTPVMTKLAAASGGTASGCTLLHDVLARRGASLEALASAERHDELVRGTVERRVGDGFQITLPGKVLAYLPDMETDAHARESSFLGSTRDFSIRLIDPVASKVVVSMCLLTTEERRELLSAQEHGTPVVGAIDSKVKGGFLVTLLDRVPAFLPFREVDETFFEHSFIGSTRPFIILRVRQGSRVVVSLRALLSEETRTTLLAVQERAEQIGGTIERKLTGGFHVTLHGQILAFLPDDTIDEHFSPHIFVGCRGDFAVREMGISSGLIVALLALRDETALLRSCEAKDRKEPVVGTIEQRVRNGFRVDLRAYGPAFLPSTEAATASVGETCEFIVIEAQVNAAIVVSRRAFLQKDALLELTPGQLVEGVIQKITKKYAKVELGAVKGFVHINDLRWGRPLRPSKVVELGQRLTFRVLGVNIPSKQCKLGLKQVTEPPWVALRQRYSPGAPVVGRVENVTDFGIFVVLDEYVSALLHLSNLGLPPGLHPSSRYRAGDEIAAVIHAYEDHDPPRIHLRDHQLLGDCWIRAAMHYPVAKVLSCTVLEITDDGARVTLEGGLHGRISADDLRRHHGWTPIPGAQVVISIVYIDTDARTINVALRSVTTAHP